VQAVCTLCHAVRDGKATLTHCKAGHEFTAENTIVRTRDGRSRSCRECVRIRDRARPPRGADYWKKINANRSNKP
jgi:hypothetical protein